MDFPILFRALGISCGVFAATLFVFFFVIWLIKWVLVKIALPHWYAVYMAGDFIYDDERYSFVKGHNFMYFPLNYTPMDELRPSGHAISFPNNFHTSPEAITLVYFHGNGEVVKEKYPFWKNEPKRTKTNLIKLEYAGYDQNKNHGILTEGAFLDSVWNSWCHLLQTYGKTKIHLVGHSIGTCFAAYIWHRNSKLPQPHPIEGILLMSPCESFLRIPFNLRILFPFLTLVDILSTYYYLDGYDGYLMVGYSETDELVPPSHATRFIEKFNADKVMYEGKHRDLIHEVKMRIIGEYLEKQAQWKTKSVHEITSIYPQIEEEQRLLSTDQLRVE